jgi:DNA-binding MarR family transcriptional regulator
MKSELSHFLPYLLNRAAEVVSQDFQPNYKNRYGMLRTEWRVLFHLGRLGEMTASQICEQAALHKTKVSRAVVALEHKRFVKRHKVETDRRSELLSLSKSGQAAFEDLSRAASSYEADLEAVLGKAEIDRLKAILDKLIAEKS